MISFEYIWRYRVQWVYPSIWTHWDGPVVLYTVHIASIIHFYIPFLLEKIINVLYWFFLKEDLLLNIFCKPVTVQIHIQSFNLLTQEINLLCLLIIPCFELIFQRYDFYMFSLKKAEEKFITKLTRIDKKWNILKT